MEQKVLNVKPRTEHGKAFSNRLRKEGRIPGVMYDRHGKASSVDADYNEFMKLFKAVTESTIVKVDLGDGKDYQVFIKDYQYDIINNKIEHFDLYEVEAGKLLRALVSIKLEGSPVGVREGGVLESGVSEIEVECFPRHLPPRIVVDVSNLAANESIHVRDIKLPEEVKVLSDLSQVVATVKYMTETVEAAPAAETEETAAAAESGETAEAPAAETKEAEAK